MLEIISTALRVSAFIYLDGGGGIRTHEPLRDGITHLVIVLVYPVMTNDIVRILGS